MTPITLSGLDEAALGPSLGPFCVCLTTFQLSSLSDGPAREIYGILSDLITKEKDKSGRLAIADSKVLYSPSIGINTLETGVTAFIGAAGVSLPCSFADLLRSLCPLSDIKALMETPWFTAAGEFPVPWPGEKPGTTLKLNTDVKAHMENRGLRMELPELRFVPARTFNKALDDHGGKGGAVRAIISPLLEHAISGIGSGERRITVDRQGGRRYYGEWLAELMPSALLRALEEGRKRSVYEVGDRRIEFLVGADGIRMETALASMIAKYVRETAMRLFNSWWAEKVSGIRFTAGYPQDARRFLSDIEAAGAMPEDRDLLIRRL
ncbi:MAG: hypothetical protein KAJ98_13165 [Spirochaetaceae bacterium]|nr:hypothetical protein [Spirochaetaceae bacterium]